MTKTDAIGFILVGLGMLWLPALAPRLFPLHLVLGVASARELWVLSMGVINTSLGLSALAFQASKQATQNPVWLGSFTTPQMTKPSRRGVLSQQVGDRFAPVLLPSSKILPALDKVVDQLKYNRVPTPIV